MKDGPEPRLVLPALGGLPGGDDEGVQGFDGGQVDLEPISLILQPSFQKSYTVLYLKKEIFPGAKTALLFGTGSAKIDWQN